MQQNFEIFFSKFSVCDGSFLEAMSQIIDVLSHYLHMFVVVMTVVISISMITIDGKLSNHFWKLTQQLLWQHT